MEFLLEWPKRFLTHLTPLLVSNVISRMSLDGSPSDDDCASSWILVDVWNFMSFSATWNRHKER